MLEYDFNTLDDDFITLWSHYILWNDAGKIIRPLESLAEKGQINAIQSWYLLKKQEEKNEVIDAMVAGFRGGSFNEELAIANREYDRIKDKLHELNKKIAFYEKQGDALADRYWDEGLRISYEQNEFYIARDRLIDEYKSSEYARHLISSANLAEGVCRNTKRATVVERLYEIYASNPIILDNNRLKKQTIKKAGKILAGYVKEHPDNVRARFALAKNYVFFSNNQKQQVEGSEILDELSKRPFISISSNSSISKNDESQQSEDTSLEI